MGYKWSERLLQTRADLQTLMGTGDLNYPGFYIISNAVTNTAIIRVEANSDSTISQAALNLTTNEFGTYNITADTFTAFSGSAFVSITRADLIALRTANSLSVTTCYSLSDSGQGNVLLHALDASTLNPTAIIYGTDGTVGIGPYEIVAETWNAAILIGDDGGSVPKMSFFGLTPAPIGAAIADSDLTEADNGRAINELLAFLRVRGDITP